MHFTLIFEKKFPIDKPSAGTLVLEVEEHAFCVDCFVGQARAATAEMPLAQGGIGLPCMALGCTNPLLFCERLNLFYFVLYKKVNYI
jgi:hypothetical protein